MAGTGMADSTRTVMLDEVDVTASRAPLAAGRAPRIVTVLGREEIAAAPAHLRHIVAARGDKRSDKERGRKRRKRTCRGRLVRICRRRGTAFTGNRQMEQLR